MLIHCVRHGESASNAEGRIQGQADIPLSPLGHRQAEALTAALAGLEIDAIFSSPLSRAVDTARPLADALNLEIQIDRRLMEIHAGLFQGVLAAELSTRFPDEAGRWRSLDPDYRVPGGETRRELMARGEAALRDVYESGARQALVVAHGGLLSAAFKALLGIPAERNPFTLYNASISTLSWRGSDIKLLSLNNIEHLRVYDCALATRTGDL